VGRAPDLGALGLLPDEDLLGSDVVLDLIGAGLVAQDLVHEFFRRLGLLYKNWLERAQLLLHVCDDRVRLNERVDTTLEAAQRKREARRGMARGTRKMMHH